MQGMENGMPFYANSQYAEKLYNLKAVCGITIARHHFRKNGFFLLKI
jgi:hypothetical protein